MKKNIEENPQITNKRFKLQESKIPNYWVLTDMDNLIVCKFKKHEFNETQEFTVLNEGELLSKMQTNSASTIARILNEMADYLVLHHYSLLFPNPHPNSDHS